MAAVGMQSNAGAKRKRSHKTQAAPVQSPPPKTVEESPRHQQKQQAQPERDAGRKDETQSSKKRKSLNQSTKEVPVEPPKQVENMALNWAIDDLTKLIDSVGAQLPKVDATKYVTTMEKLDWGQVAFGGHSAEDCRDKWKEVIIKVRRYRTLTELVVDAREWVKYPWKSYTTSKAKQGKHPGLPKKPLTPYFRYFLEKREKYSKDNPTMSMTDLAKLLAKKYSDLPEKKKQKYKDNYMHDNQSYKVLMEKFREEHPDMYPEEPKAGKASVKRPVANKPLSPYQMFLADKMTKHTNLDPPERKEYEEKYRYAWVHLQDSKKLKYIRKSMAMEKALQADTDHPDHKPEFKKSVLTKADRDVLDKMTGKPEKPPSSGYSLYSKILLKELSDYPTNKRMVEIAKRWKELSDKDRQTYVKRARDAADLYQVQYATYLSTLPEDERNKLELQKGKGTAKAPKPRPENKKQAVAAARPKKTMTAVSLYQQEKLPQYVSRNPDKSEPELNRQLAKEFAELSDKKKEKYKKMAEAAQKQNGTAAPAPRVDSRKPQLYKDEPKKPPTSGYLVFSSEQNPKLTKVDPKQRMVEISHRWKALTPAEQEKYKKKSADLNRKYKKEHDKFVTGLSDHDRQQYEELQRSTAAKKNAAKGKVQAKVAKQEPVEESEDDDDDDDDQESGKDDSSADSDSDSDSSSSEGSDKSDSGSDSDSKSEADSSSSNSDSDNTKGGSSDSSSDDDSDSDGSGSDAESSSGSDK